MQINLTGEYCNYPRGVRVSGEEFTRVNEDSI